MARAKSTKSTKSTKPTKRAPKVAPTLETVNASADPAAELHRLSPIKRFRAELRAKAGLPLALALAMLASAGCSSSSPSHGTLRRDACGTVRAACAVAEHVLCSAGGHEQPGSP